MSAEPRLAARDLLADRTLVGLSSAEELVLERLLAESGEPDAFETDGLELELAAAELDRGLAPAVEPMPADLRRRLLATAADYARRPSTLRALPPLERAARPGAPSGAPSSVRRPTPPLALAGWLVAAAACLVAFLAWNGTRGGRPGSAPSPSEQRAGLLARAGTLRLDCSATEQAPGAGGDVAWSQELQQGVLHLVGLKPNDPAVEQYQLWIFDEAQAHPVDGGVFDVAAGEVLVPIDAKLPVQKPTLFAITVEKPGGVVVSDRQRIVLVAQI